MRITHCSNPGCGVAESEDKKLLGCSVCKSVAYCGATCQRLHWKTHKKECKELLEKRLAMEESGGGGDSQPTTASTTPAPTQPQPQQEQQQQPAAAVEVEQQSEKQAEEQQQQQQQQEEQKHQDPTPTSTVAVVEEVLCCANCASTEKDLHNCSACKSVFYCSRDCQLADWQNHKAKCKQVAAEKAAAKKREEAESGSQRQQREEAEAAERLRREAEALKERHHQMHLEMFQEETWSREEIQDAEDGAFYNQISEVARGEWDQIHRLDAERAQEEEWRRREAEEEEERKRQEQEAVMYKQGSEEQPQHSQQPQALENYEETEYERRAQQAEEAHRKELEEAERRRAEEEAKAEEEEEERQRQLQQEREQQEQQQNEAVHHQHISGAHASHDHTEDQRWMKYENEHSHPHSHIIEEEPESPSSPPPAVANATSSGNNNNNNNNNNNDEEDNTNNEACCVVEAEAPNPEIAPLIDEQAGNVAEQQLNRDTPTFGVQEEGKEQEVDEIVTASEHQVGIDPETGNAIMGTERREIDFEAEFEQNQENEDNERRAEKEQQQEESTTSGGGGGGGGRVSQAELSKMKREILSVVQKSFSDFKQELVSTLLQEQNKKKQKSPEEEEADFSEKQSSQIESVVSGLHQVLQYQREAAKDLEKHFVILRNTKEFSSDFRNRHEEVHRENEQLQSELTGLRTRLIPSSPSGGAGENEDESNKKKVRVYAELGSMKLNLPTTLTNTVGVLKSAALQRASQQGFIPPSSCGWKDWFLSFVSDETVLFDDDTLEDVGAEAGCIFRLSKQGGGEFYMSSPASVQIASPQQQQQQQQNQSGRNRFTTSNAASAAAGAGGRASPATSTASVANSMSVQGNLSSPTYSLSIQSPSTTNTATPTSPFGGGPGFSPTSVISTFGSSSAAPSNPGTPSTYQQGGGISNNTYDREEDEEAQQQQQSTLLLRATVLESEYVEPLASEESLERRLAQETRRMELEAMEAEERAARKSLRLRRIQNIRARLMDKTAYGKSEPDRIAAREAYARLNAVVDGMKEGIIQQKEVEFAILNAEVVLSREPVAPSEEENERVSALLAAEDASVKERSRLVIDIKDMIDMIRYKLTIDPNKFREVEDLLHRATTISSMIPIPGKLTLQGMLSELMNFIKSCGKK